jgi:hypothetical protein
MAQMLPSDRPLEIQELLQMRQSMGQFQASFAAGPAPAAAPTPTAQAAVVVLKGLVGAAVHNGKRATVLGFAADRGRFTVELQGANGGGAARRQLSVKPQNVELASVPAKVVVGVGGLVGAAEHNGKRGTVVGGPDAETGRYTVRLEEGGTLGLKLQNLRLVDAMEADQLAHTSALSLQEPQPELEAAGPLAAASVGAEEDLVVTTELAADPFIALAMAWPTGEPVGSLDGFLAGPPESGAGLLQYSAMLVGLGAAELTESALAEAGITKVFHRKRIAKWFGSLVKIS